MKKVIVILFFNLVCGFSTGNAQTRFDGVFERHSHYEIWYNVESFTFRKDGTFELLKFTDTGNLFGVGEYLISEGKLILEFKECEIKDKMEDRDTNLSKSILGPFNIEAGEVWEYYFKSDTEDSFYVKRWESADWYYYVRKKIN